MTREERAREHLHGSMPERARLLQIGSPGGESWLLQSLLSFADAEVAAMRERAADVPRQVSGIIGAHYGSSIDSALCEVEAAIRALPATGEVGRD